MPLKFELAEMQKTLESWNFNLYFDEKRKEWELMSVNSSYSLTGEIKEEVIRQGFYYLISG